MNKSRRPVQRVSAHLPAFILLIAGVVAAVAADSAAVPPPPVERADRFGVYNWNVDYAAYPEGGELDRLNWAAGKVAALGSRTIRVTLPGIFYHVSPPGRPDLAATAASAAYDRLFSDPRFKTYLLTAYSWAELRDMWADGLTEEEADAARGEVARLGEYLLSNARYAGKTFIVLNWEGDNAMAWKASQQTAWDSYTAWIQARADGVKEARRRHPESAARLFSGLEFSTVTSLKTGLPCGTPVADPLRQDALKNRCVIDYVAPRVDVDYYSYSAWHTLDVKFGGPDASFKDAFKRDLGFALDRVRALRPEVAEANFIIGEFGFHRTRWGENTTANFVNEFMSALEAADAFRVSYAVFWQVIDNTPLPFVWEDGFGLFKSRDGRLVLSRAGEVFKRRIAGQVVPVYPPGPAIRRAPVPGVLDPATNTPDFRLNPDSLLSIHAGGCCQGVGGAFSAEGNQVHLQQGFNRHVMTRDNAVFFSESESRITASLPPGRLPGWATVFVTDRDGVDSNAQFIRLGCAECPAIRAQHGVLDGLTYLDETRAGGVVSVFGYSFSPQGNTVKVRQMDDRNALRTFTLARDEVWYESPNQINARLPADLLARRYAVVTVTDAEGRESAEYVIYVIPDCDDCPPTVRPHLGLVNRDTSDETFYADSALTIFGARFSASGNKVVVEQAGRRYFAPRDEMWGEAATKITASLPAEVVPSSTRTGARATRGRFTCSAGASGGGLPCGGDGEPGHDSTMRLISRR
jgi:hypothetical protein